MGFPEAHISHFPYNVCIEVHTSWCDCVVFTQMSAIILGMSLKLIQGNGRLCSDAVNSNTTVLTKLMLNSRDKSYIVKGLT